jgi:hypothetical protein
MAFEITGVSTTIGSSYEARESAIFQLVKSFSTGDCRRVGLRVGGGDLLRFILTAGVISIVGVSTDVVVRGEFNMAMQFRLDESARLGRGDNERFRDA